MSPSVYRGSNPDETPRARRLAHSHTYATFALAAVGIGTAGPWWRDVDYPWAVVAVVIAVVIAVFAWEIAAIHCWHRHPMAVCVTCLTDIPTDGAVQALRYDRRLRTYHLRGDRKYLLATGSLLVTSLVMASTGPTWMRWMGAAGLIGYWALVVHDSASGRTHMRLAPWCPYCKGRGDDDPSPVVAPTPDPVGEKVRT